MLYEEEHLGASRLPRTSFHFPLGSVGESRPTFGWFLVEEGSITLDKRRYQEREAYGVFFVRLLLQRSVSPVSPRQQH